MPDDWKVDLATDGAVLSDVPIGTLGRRLVEVRAIAYFHGTDEMARYRVATDSQVRTTELQIPLVDLGCRPAELDWDLVPSSVGLPIRDDEEIRPPEPRRCSIADLTIVGVNWSAHWKVLGHTSCPFAIQLLTFKSTSGVLRWCRRKPASKDG